MSDNELTTKLNILPGDTEAAAAQLEAFNQRITGIRQRTDTLNKGFESLEKIKLDNLKQAFQMQGVDQLNKEVKQLREELVRTDNSTGMDNIQKYLADTRKKMEELRNEFRTGAKDVDRFTKEMSELEQQARKLDAALDAAGEKRRLDTGTGELVDPSKQGSGSGLRQFGRELRNLPSTQIPGLGIGTDAVGNITRVSGALVDAGEKSKVATAAVNLLTPALGAQAAATAGAFAPIALLVAGFATIGIALKSLVDATSSNVDRINAFAENQRNLNSKIAGGLTTEDAQKELDKLTEAQSRNKGTLTELLQSYYSAEDQLGALSGVVKVFSGDEEALSNQINETTKSIDAQQAEINVLKRALDEGALATNDAAIQLEKLIEKEKELTTQRQTSIDKIQSLNDQEADLNKKFNDQQIRDMIDRARQSTRVDEAYKLRDLRAEEDHNRQLEKLNKSHQDQITKTAENGQKQVGDALDALEKKDADIAEKRVDALEEFNEKIADADAKYRKQAEKDAIEFGRRRREIENDFQRNTSEARLDFDVRGFRDAQDEQKRELADLKTDRKDAKNERLDELAEEREATAENHNERLEQLDEELQKAREQTAERIIQIQQQTEEQIVSSALTHQERLKEDADTRQITRERELEDRKILADQQKVDLDILLARQKTANDSQIQHLNDLELKELAIYYERDAQLTALLEKEKLLTTGLGGTSGKPASNNWWDMLPTVPTTGDYPVLPDAPITPGGVGGDKLLNPNSLTRRSPLANPAAFAANPGGASGRSGGVNTTYQINMTVGEHVTKKDLDKIKKTIRDTQSETVAGIELAFFEGKKVIR